MSSVLTLEAVAWYDYCSDFPGGLKKTQPVKGKAANALGLYDMSGNVMEWCYDWHWMHIGSERILMGGSWNGNIDNLFVGQRSAGDPEFQSYGAYGFRLARTAE
jgi:formylglycine-generating enzyme required for sulfatase activity